jgi:hypothetical protein
MFTRSSSEPKNEVFIVGLAQILENDLVHIPEDVNLDGAGSPG